MASWKNRRSGDDLVIVTLTSITSRSHLLGKVIGAILHQSRPPDLIYLNISDEAFFLDQGITFETLPERVRKWIVRGRVRLTTGPNLGPYRKLLPALERHRDDKCVIVTADDDVVYPPDWLSGLLKAHAIHGGIAAYRCRAMVIRDGVLAPYHKWPVIEPDESVDYGDIRPECEPLFRSPTGRSGVLYRPEFFQSWDLLQTLAKLAPLQDDLGFKMASLLSRVPVTVVPAIEAASDDMKFKRAGKTDDNLHVSNRKGNDKAIKALFSYVEENQLFSWSEFTR